LERGQRPLDILRTVGRLADALRVGTAALLGEEVDVEVRLVPGPSPAPMSTGPDDHAMLMEVVERVARVLDAPAAIDAAVVQGLEAVTAAYASRYASGRPEDLLTPVQQQVDRVTAALDGSLLPSLRTRLLNLLGDTAAMTGWVALLLDRRGTASSFLALAWRAAGESGDVALQANVLASRSVLASRFTLSGTRAGRTALLLTRQAEEMAPGTLPVEARSWLASRHAKEAADAGDLRAFHAAADRARIALPAARSAPAIGSYFSSVGRFRSWNAGYVRASEGTGLAALGRLDEAERALAAALALTGDGRRRSAILTDLAAVSAQRGEIDAACNRATSALDQAEAAGYALGRRVLRGLLTRLGPWQGRAEVHALSERLRAA